MLDLALLAGLGAAVLGAAGLTLLRAKTRERRIAARHPPLGRFVTVEGRRLHLWQAGSGPDLVMIHGASANLREFAMGLAPALTDRFRVTLIDRPGLGWSDGGAEDLPGQARLMRLATEAAGVTRPLVLGHSYGGAVALAWAAQVPVAGLLLLSGVALPWTGGLGAWYAVTSTRLGRALAIPLVTAWLPMGRIDRVIEALFAPQCRTPNYASEAGVRLILRRKAMAANTAQMNLLLDQVRDLQAHYHTIAAPTEIVHGTSDTIVPAQIHAIPLAQILPEAHLTLLPEVGHMPHQTHAPAVKEAVLRLAARAGLRLD